MNLKDPMKNNHVSLLNKQATGGDIAEGGFKSQDNLIVARIPAWLINDGFSEMIREALGDVEAKFFSPEIGESREFIEYKNYNLTPSKFWPEIERFYQMDQGAPGAYSKFTLVSNGLSKKLDSIVNALRRIRDAESFYDGAENILAESYSDFMKSVRKHKKSDEMGRFIHSKVRIEIETDAEQFAKERFRESLFKNFPATENLSGKTINNINSNLVELIGSRKNKTVLRNEIEQRMWADAEPQYCPTEEVKCHIIHEKIDRKNPPKGAIQFEWIKYFGGEHRKFPSACEWENLINQLKKTKNWINKYNRPKHISIFGKMRLSACIAMGSAFSSTAGFFISYKTKDGVWCSNAYPDANTPAYEWIETNYSGSENNEIVFGIGVIRDVLTEVEQYLISEGKTAIPRLYLHSPKPLQSANQINQAINDLKTLLLDFVAKHRPTKIHLFVAAPAQFAMFLGHRLNVSGVIQCYERILTGVYTATCELNMS